MRLLYVCHLDIATCDYPLFLAQSWEALGHQARLFAFDLDYQETPGGVFWERLTGGDPALRARLMERRLSSVCRDWRPDVLLLGGQFVTPRGLSRLRNRHGFLAGVVLGYNHLLEGDTAALIRLADFLVVHDSYLIPVLRGTRYGKVKHVFHLRCMANPAEHLPLDLSDDDRRRYGGDVAFVGGPSANRIELLRSLADLDLRVWGTGWQDVAPMSAVVREEPVYGLTKTKIYNAARIVLNLEDDEKQVNAISNRIPEVLACGGFVLTDWRADLAGTGLVDGESVAVFRKAEELRERVLYYLDHPRERERIGAAGRAVVLQSMTYDAVAGQLIREIEALLASR